MMMPKMEATKTQGNRQILVLIQIHVHLLALLGLLVLDLFDHILSFLAVPGQTAHLILNEGMDTLFLRIGRHLIGQN